MYTTIPVNVAVSVPIGIDFLGFLKSPERPTPAVIPVNAGKITAKTVKNPSGFLTVENTEKPVSPISAVGPPMKKLMSEKANIPTTT